MALQGTAQGVLLSNNYKAIKQLTDMVAEIRLQNTQLAAANAAMGARLAAMEGRGQTAAKGNVMQKEWPALPGGSQFGATAFTKVVRRHKPQFSATQYVAGGKTNVQNVPTRRKGGC